MSRRFVVDVEDEPGWSAWRSAHIVAAIRRFAYMCEGHEPRVTVTEITDLPPLPEAPERWVVEYEQTPGGWRRSVGVAPSLSATWDEADAAILREFDGRRPACYRVRRLEDGEQ